MEQVNGIRKKVYKIQIISIVVISVLSWFLIPAPLTFVLGLIIGSAIAALNFYELGNTIMQSVRMNPNDAQAFSTKKYFIRYLISGVVLFVSVNSNYINVLGTLLGLLLIKFIIYATNLFDDKEYYKNIIKRKEG